MPKPKKVVKGSTKAAKSQKKARGGSQPTSKVLEIKLVPASESDSSVPFASGDSRCPPATLQKLSVTVHQGYPQCQPLTREFVGVFKEINPVRSTPNATPGK